MKIVGSEESDKMCGTKECCYVSYQPKREQCTRLGRCLVMHEFRQSPEDHRRNYATALRKRAAEQDAGAKPADVIHHLQRAGIPQRNLDPLLAETKQTSSLVGAKAWWSKLELGGASTLVLTGNSGIGKSTAAAWCALQYALIHPWNSGPSGPQRSPIVWLEGGQLAQLPEWSQDGREELERARNCKLLVINDGGLEATKTAMQVLANLCILRSDFDRWTIFTSNLVSTEFVGRYGNALADRFRTHASVPAIEREKTMRRKGQTP